MPNNLQGKTSSSAVKPAAMKNETSKPNGEVTPAKSAGVSTPKPTAKGASANSPKKAVGNLSGAKPATTSQTSTTESPSTVTPSAADLKPASKTVAANTSAKTQSSRPAAAAAEGSNSASVTAKPAATVAVGAVLTPATKISAVESNPAAKVARAEAPAPKPKTVVSTTVGQNAKAESSRADSSEATLVRPQPKVDDRAVAHVEEVTAAAHSAATNARVPVTDAADAAAVAHAAAVAAATATAAASNHPTGPTGSSSIAPEPASLPNCATNAAATSGSNLQPASAASSSVASTSGGQHVTPQATTHIDATGLVTATSTTDAAVAAAVPATTSKVTTAPTGTSAGPTDSAPVEGRGEACDTTSKSPVGAAAAAPVTISPRIQITTEPVVNCIAVKPTTANPSIKSGPSIKVISAPPLRAVSTGDADVEYTTGAATGASLPAERSGADLVQPHSTEAPKMPRRTGSTAWEEATIPANTEPLLPAASAPVTIFEAPVSRKSLDPRESPALQAHVVAAAASLPPQPSTPPPPAPPVVSSTGSHDSATADGDVQATAGLTSSNAPFVVIILEHNRGGPCPVQLALSTLDPGKTGEVMVADLVTTTIKALRAKYGAVQVGAAVNAFFVEQSPLGEAAVPERRRWLSTYDAVPQELLAAAATSRGAHVILQGVTCSDGRPTEVSPAFPLPGFTEAHDPGSIGPLPARVTFLSETGSGRPTPNPALIAPRGLLRGASHAGSGSGSGVPPAPTATGGRILGAGHRSVRIRLDENTVETLCVESAAPSATSQQSQFRGARLPPLRNDSGTGGISGGGDDVGDDGNTGRSPFRGRLGITRSSRRLILPANDIAAESVGSSEFENSGALPSNATLVKQDPVQVLGHSESVGADLEVRVTTAVGARNADDDGGDGPVAAGAAGEGPARGISVGGAPSSVTSAMTKRKASHTGVESATAPPVSSAAPSSTVKKPALFVRSEADPASGEDLEAAYFPAPTAEWVDLMGSEPLEVPESSQSGGCLACFSASSKEAQHRAWRERLQTALKNQDEAEVAAWVTFHCGRNGTRNQSELDAALWLAVEARAADLVRVLLRGGAHPDAPRPMGPFYAVGTARNSYAPSGTRPVSAARVKDSTVRSTPPTPPLPTAWWPGSSSTATAALEGLTPLMRAAELASFSVVEALLAGGANAVIVQPVTGWTAVHRAILATPHSAVASADRRLPAAGGIGAGSGASTSSSSSAVAAATGKGKFGGHGGADGDAPAAGLNCLRLLVQRIGLQCAAALTTEGRHADDLVRFAVRHGRSAALSWLMAAGLSPDGGGTISTGDDDDDDEVSCPFLAGQLGLTVEVWDTPPPVRQAAASAGTLRDPARPLSWLSSPEERLFADRRRQLLMGAAAGGRVDVLEAVLDKPPPFDRLRRDELEAAIGACRLAQPRNQRQVEELLARKAHTYMSWEREMLPALRRFDESVVGEWLMRDRPMPVEVDRALVALLSSERLGAPLWQDNAKASVQALLDAGADIEHEWDVDPAASPITASVATIGRDIKRLRPLQAALLAPAPAIVRQLLAAGADPRRRDAEGENALFFAIRTAAAAAAIAREYDDPDSIRMVRPQQGNINSSGGRHGAAGAAEAEAAAVECISILLETDYKAELLGARNDKGLTPVVLSALGDMKDVLIKLCVAGADPWATPLPAAPGAPEAPRELLPSVAVSGGGKRFIATGVWSVGHETARVGALSTLAVLLGDPLGVAGRNSPLAAANTEQAAARRRDALLGAIRGGRVGTAKLALDYDGISGSLYEGELAAALALCKSSAAALPLPPPPGAADVVSAIGGAFGSDPPRYEALSAFLASRAHVYMSWNGEVLPAVRAANMGVVRRWIAYDKVSAADATRALCALVEVAQQCNTSCSAVAADGSLAVASTVTAAGGNEGNAIDGVVRRLSSMAVARLATPGRAEADVAVELVKAGADVNFHQESSAGGQSLLMQVAFKGHLPLLEVLLSLGARVDAEDAAGMTAVDHAVLARARLDDNGCLNALLAAYGSRRLNAHRNQAGDSALMLAVRTGDSKAVQLLLAAGATPAAPDANAPARTSSMSAAAAASTAASIGGVLGSSRTRTSDYYTSPNPSSATDAPSTAAAAAAAIVASGGNAVLSSSSSMSAPSQSVALSGRSLDTLASGLDRRGSALYLAARMNDKAMLQQLLRKASNDDGGMESCRQEVQLGALHGGRLALLEASLALPELLKAVPGPADGVGAAALTGAAAVCARLSEQAAARLAEAQGLVVQLEAIAPDAVAAAGAAEAASMSALGLTRLGRYLSAKTAALEALKVAHGRMGDFYGLARLHMEALEGSLEAKKELVSSSIRNSSDAQVKLMAATTRLTASKDSVLRSVLARRDAQLGRVEALLEKKLAGLTAAQRRAEAKVTNDVEVIIMDMRKLVGKRMKDIEAKKQEGYSRLGALERKVDMVWGRRQRLLASRPPAMRVALNQKMGALMQQLGARRDALNEVLAAAVAKVEGGQRRGTALVDMDSLRQALARIHQDMARSAYEAATIAKAALAERAEELLRNDKHDQLLRIVGHMQAEVTRGSSSTAAASAKTLAALQQAYAIAVADLERRLTQARTRMQEHLTALVASHAELVNSMTMEDDTAQGEVAVAALSDAPPVSNAPPPDVASFLLDFEGAAALDGVEGVPVGVGIPKCSAEGVAADEDSLSVLRRVTTVEEMIEDMIEDMAAQVLHAFPADTICDILGPADLEPLLEPDLEISTAGLGIERLRQDVAAIDFGLPNLDLEVGDLDLSALDDEEGGGRACGVSSAAMGLGGYEDYEEEEVVVADIGARAQVRGSNAVAGTGGGYPYKPRRSSDEGDSEPTGRGRYHAADYGDRHEDDFALSYS